MSNPYTVGWPKEIVYGEDPKHMYDMDVVPLSDAERMREALRDALADFEFFEMDAHKSAITLRPIAAEAVRRTRAALQSGGTTTIELQQRHLRLIEQLRADVEQLRSEVGDG